jgi:hypothetical protein
VNAVEGASAKERAASDELADLLKYETWFSFDIQG